MTDTAPPDPATPPAAPRTPVAAQDPSFWKFGPPEPGNGPKPMRYDPVKHAEAMAELAAKSETAADGASGAENGPQIDAAPAEHTTAGDDTTATFADAFAPPWQDDDDGGFTPEDYQALADEYDSAEAEPGDDTGADGEPASQREARYRIRAREAETRLADAAAENGRLHDELDTMRRSQAEALAAGRLADAGDLFREHGIEEVISDDGTVDPQRVNELVDAITAEHPHWAVARPAADPNRLRSGAHKPDEVAPPSWQRAFAPRAK